MGHQAITRLNDLPGKEYLFRTRTTWTTAYPSEVGHGKRKVHGGNKPPRLMADLIQTFTQPGHLVLDPFAGVGGTLLGASMTGRRAIGVELDPRWTEIYREVAADAGFDSFRVVEEDCRVAIPRLLDEFGEGFADFVATDPPYGLNFERTMCGLNGGAPSTRHAKRRTDFEGFNQDPRNLANLPDFDAFFAAIAEICGLLFTCVRPGGYMAMILRNAYQHGEYIMTAARVAEESRRMGWKLKGEIIWMPAGARLRPYGYPRAWIPNITHQSILILRRDVPGK